MIAFATDWVTVTLFAAWQWSRTDARLMPTALRSRRVTDDCSADGWLRQIFRRGLVLTPVLWVSAPPEQRGVGQGVGSRPLHTCRSLTSVAKNSVEDLITVRCRNSLLLFLPITLLAPLFANFWFNLCPPLLPLRSYPLKMPPPLFLTPFRFTNEQMAPKL